METLNKEATAMIKGTLSPEQIEANRQYYKSLVGKNVTLNVTGLIVNGKVKEFTECEHGFNLSIDHAPVRWGESIYTHCVKFARKLDNWGSLNNVSEAFHYNCKFCGKETSSTNKMEAPFLFKYCLDCAHCID